jgi:hypothetical protein
MIANAMLVALAFYRADEYIIRRRSPSVFCALPGKSLARMYKTGQRASLYKRGQREHLKVPRIGQRKRRMMKLEKDGVVWQVRRADSRTRESSLSDTTAMGWRFWPLEKLDVARGLGVAGII